MWKIIGQEQAVALIDSSLRKGMLSHAYLFLGPDGVGKRTLALELAKAVNCLNPEPPCGICPSCLRIGSGRHSDIISYNLSSQAEETRETLQKEDMVAARRREIGTDKIRELQRIAYLSPFEGRKKVFIIEEADRLSEEASNRLLKILEEPPATVLIILLSQSSGATNGTQKVKGGILPTLVSRCQIVQLHPLSFALLEKTLVSDWGVEPKRAGYIARISQGCPGLALKYLKSPDILRKREEKLMGLIPLVNSGMEARFTFVQKITEESGKNWETILESLTLWLLWWRDLYLWKSGSREYVINLDQEAFVHRQAMSLQIGQIARAMYYLNRAKSHLEARANTRLVLEDLMLHLPQVSAA